MTPVLYLHGFASSPESSKIVLLRPLLAVDHIQLVTPDLNLPSFGQLSWKAMVDATMNVALHVKPKVLAGSSLGALIALACAQRGMNVPLVLIAPALGMADQWVSRLPEGDPIMVPNHATGHEEPTHRRFFEEMSDVDVDHAPPGAPVSILMGAKDETVPVARVTETWSRWQASGQLHPDSRLQIFEDGDHQLTSQVEQIAEEIVARGRG